MTKTAFRGLVICAVLGALVFRTAGLGLRPMHHDEANQAVKFGALLERGEYRYDPADHHGPSLYYLTLPFAWVASGTSFPALSETTLRLVPALFGTALILVFILFAGGLAREGIFFAGLIAAISPAMTYYGRFYIQETLLVFFLAAFIASGWRYVRTGSGWWAAAAGFAAGMMYATKETSVILFAAAGGSLLLGKLFRKREPPVSAAGRPLKIVHAVWFLGAAVVTAGLLYTSFFRNPGGLADSVRAFGGYFTRAGGAGLHAEPWYYYLKLLAYSRFGDGPAWSEAFVLALAIAGTVSAFGADAGKDGHPRFLRFMVFFTALTGIAFSAIPYKTPWNVLPFNLGIVVLAGAGAGLLWRAGRFRIVRAVVLVVLLPGLLTLFRQDYRANFVDYANPTNPYVYAQTTRDFLGLVRAVDGIAAESPEGKNTLIKVVAPPEETWPLPWYLRGYSKVGYWTDPADAGKLAGTPVVITSADFALKVGPDLGEGYEFRYFGLRPEIVLSLFARQDLWDAYVSHRQSGRER